VEWKSSRPMEPVKQEERAARLMPDRPPFSSPDPAWARS
jgi:hypothetical protein